MFRYGIWSSYVFLQPITVTVWMIAVLLSLLFALPLIVKFLGCILMMEEVNVNAHDTPSDKIETKPFEEHKFVGDVAGLSISKIESDFFSKLRAEIKEGLSESLDYSLLEDQVLPEMYESSPDVETKQKRFSVGLSNLLKNMTLYDNHNWEEDISDESFVRTEKRIRGSEYRIANENKYNLVNISIDADNTNDSLDSVIELDNKYPVEKSVFDKNNASPCTSPKLHEGDLNIINEETEKSDMLSTNSVVTNNSHDSLASDSKSSENTINLEVVSANNDSLDCPNESSNSETMKFNDTIEEMEHFLKYGFKQNIKKPEPVLKTHPVESATIKITKEAKTFGKLPSRLNTPISQKPPKVKIVEGKRLASPAYNVTPFKLPNKTNQVYKNFDPRSPMQKQAFLNHRLDRYDNVVSPVRYYINNSPTVPMLKNVSPAKNYWDRAPPKNFNSKLRMPKINLGKENSHLPEKAYKSPKFTTVIDKPSVKRLPKNNGVITMAENLPKVIVIKHMKREKLNDDDKKFASALKPSNNSDRNSVEDSFAHLPIKSMDVSHCVGQQAGRSHTLK